MRSATRLRTHLNRLLLVISASAAIAPLHAQEGRPSPSWSLTERQVAMSKHLAAKCLLEVTGKTYISGLCDVSIIDAAGSFILTEKARAPYFAYVIIDPDDKTTADGSWNRIRGADHAHAPLGDRVLHLRDGCWFNEGAKVCWSRK